MYRKNQKIKQAFEEETVWMGRRATAAPEDDYGEKRETVEEEKCMGMLAASRIVNLWAHILDSVHLQLLRNFNFFQPSIATAVFFNLPNFFTI